jgi:hypothetical protein
VPNNSKLPNKCPYDNTNIDWQLDGEKIDFGECLEDGCNGASTTYMTIDEKIYFDCPDCGHKSNITIEDKNAN